MAILSGRVALANGVASQLGTGSVNQAIIVKAGESNTVSIFVGNNGSNTVTSGTGMELGAGDATLFNRVGKLDDIYVIAYAVGQYVYWQATEV